MAYAVNHFPADGNTRLFQIDFDYLSKDHVSVLVDGEPVAFTFNDTYTIDITSGAPLAGSIVEVRRITPLDKRLVDFQDGSVLAESDLDMMNLQLLYVSQEAVDKTESAMIEGSTGELDALGRQIKNLKTPTADADAATKAYVDTGAVVHVQAAAAEHQATTEERIKAEAAVISAEAARDATLTLHDETQGFREDASVKAMQADEAANRASAAALSIAQKNVDRVYDDITLQPSANGRVVAVYCTTKDIQVVLPLCADLGEPGEITVIKKDDTAFKVVVTGQGTDTVEQGSSYELTSQNSGGYFLVDLDVEPDDWSVLPYGAAVGDVESLGAMKPFPNLASLAAGGDYLEVNGTHFLVAGWPDLAALVYCGDALNAAAEYWYRFNDPALPNTSRSVTGAYMKLPPRSAYQPSPLKRFVLPAVPTTSGAIKDITGVPTTARKIEVAFNEVSMADASHIQIYLLKPDGTPYPSSGYLVTSITFNASNGTAGGSFGSNVTVYDGGSSNVASGKVEIDLDALIATGLVKVSASNLTVTGGSLPVAATQITGVRVASSIGGAFDGGSITVSYYDEVAPAGVLGIKATNSIKVPVTTDVSALLAKTQEQNARIAAINSGTPDISFDVVAWSLPLFQLQEHGFGAIPSRVESCFVLTTAVDGIPAGTEVEFGGVYSGATTATIAQVLRSATHYGVSLRNSAFYVSGITTTTALTPANSFLRVKAWKGTTLTGTSLTYAEIAGLLADRSRVAPDYDPAPFACTAGATFTLAHGLGAIPKRVELSFIVTTAFGGFAVGQEIPWAQFYGSGQYGPPGALSFDATNIYGRFFVNNVFTTGLSTGGEIAAPWASMQLKVRAWR